MTRQCESGKARHSNLERVKVAAHRFAIALNAEGQIACNMYAYRCDTCRGWHITRQAGWDGVVLVLEAAPESLQRWAMGQG